MNIENDLNILHIIEFGIAVGLTKQLRLMATKNQFPFLSNQQKKNV